MLAPATLAAREIAGFSICERFCGSRRGPARAAMRLRSPRSQRDRLGRREALGRASPVFAPYWRCPERPKRHVAGLHTVMPRGEDMAELMQQNAEEEDRDEKRALPSGINTALAVINGAEPDEKQKERDMDADRCAADRSNIE